MKQHAHPRQQPVRPRQSTLAAAALLSMAGLSACGGGDSEPNVKPDGLGNIRATSLDGRSNDLLTAGLGKTGLASPLAPAYADPLAPTAVELRRTAIHSNYRAMVDMTEAGGYGVFYGPNVAPDGTVTTDEGKVAGKEYHAFADDGTGRLNVGLMVQVPAQLRSRQALHHHRHGLGLARGVWRHLHWRMGAQTRLCGGLQRQRHRGSASRPPERHRAIDRWHPQQCDSCGQERSLQCGSVGY